MFAKAFHAKDQICIGETCVNEDQLKALLAAQNGAQTASAGSTTPTASSTPIIQINGNNPAMLAVGVVYADLGASITGPTTADTNLGIRYFVDGIAVSEVQIDTATSSTHTVDYVATNDAGTATSTRTVVIGAVAELPSADVGETEANPSGTSAQGDSNIGTGLPAAEVASSSTSQSSLVIVPELVVVMTATSTTVVSRRPRPP